MAYGDVTHMTLVCDRGHIAVLKEGWQADEVSVSASWYESPEDYGASGCTVTASWKCPHKDCYGRKEMTATLYEM